MTWPQLVATFPGLDWTLLLVYLRVQAFVMALPALGERVIPVRVRVAIAMSLSPLLAAAVARVAMPDGPALMLAQAAGQMVIGLSAGMLLRLLALSIDIATSAIAATASLSQIVGGQNEAAPHPIGNMLHLGGVAILMALGAPVMMVQLMADSFLLWPIGTWPDAGMMMSEAVRVLSYSFGLAMLLAAPFSLGGFLFQALSGVVNRVMPALPVVFIGSPIAVLMALAALAILAPMLIGIWSDVVLSFTLPRSG